MFDGQAGYLDHALANPSLAAQVTGAADWHINADEPDLLDYDTSFKPPAQDAIYEPNAYRSSDRDPVVVGLSPCEETPPALSVTASPSTLSPPNHKYTTVNTTITATDNSGAAPTVTLVSVTSNEPDDAPGDADGRTINDIASSTRTHSGSELNEVTTAPAGSTRSSTERPTPAGTQRPRQPP